MLILLIFFTLVVKTTTSPFPTKLLLSVTIFEWVTTLIIELCANDMCAPKKMWISKMNLSKDFNCFLELLFL